MTVVGVWQAKSSHPVTTCFNCAVCKKKITNKDALMSHLWDKDECVENNWTYQWHEYQKQKAQWQAEKPFVCHINGCGRGFGSLNALTDHCFKCNTSDSQQAEKWAALKPFTCLKCHAGCKDPKPGCHTKSFKSQEAFDSHMAGCGKTEGEIKLETEIWLKEQEDTRFQCDRCKIDNPYKFFETKDALTQHQTVCGKSQQDLHRDWLAANPYECRFCQQRWPRLEGRGGLENHISSNHHELVEAEADFGHATENWEVASDEAAEALVAADDWYEHDVYWYPSRSSTW